MTQRRREWIPIRKLIPVHGTNPKHRSRTKGPITVVMGFFGGLRIWNGHHRVADAKRAGKSKIEANVFF